MTVILFASGRAGLLWWDHSLSRAAAPPDHIETFDRILAGRPKMNLFQIAEPHGCDQ